jgi:ssDNA-binding Zn-finger/Zn-ribbon topoisomerase 1
MVDIRCPKCGKKTTLRASRTSGRSYFICLNYPKCRGRVPVEEDLSGTWSEENPVPEPASDRDRESLAQAPGDEDWSGGWGEASRTPEAAHDSTQQRKEPSSAKSGGGTAVRKSGKAKHGSHAVIKRPERQGRVSIDKSRGDDRDKEKPAPKPAADRARRHVAPKPEVAPEKKEPLRSRPKIVAKKEGPPEPQRQKVPKPASYRPQYKRGPGSAPVSPQEPEKPKPAPYRPLYQKAPRWETVPEVNESSEPQGRGKTKPASYKPQYKRGPKAAPVPPQEPSGPPPTPYRPQYPRAQKRGLSSGEQKPSKPRRHKAPQAAHEEPRPQKAPKPAQERP